MSTTPAQSKPDSGIPGLDDRSSGVPSGVIPRHSLGLPAGSVRAILALSVLGLLWALVLTLKPEEKLPPLFLYLELLMVLILAHFFAAHGSSISQVATQHHPLFLPRGSIRFLLTAGLAGLVVWYGVHPEIRPGLGEFPFYLPLVLLGGFLGGFLLTWLVRAMNSGRLPFWFQDIEAWLALLCMVGLGIGFAVNIFILPSLEPESTFRTRIPEIALVADPVLAAVISFYFGSRS
jgi:hypothetical protein